MNSTPGPYIVKGDNKGNAPPYYIVREYDNGYTIVAQTVDGANETQRANVYMLASAPELAEMLKNIVISAIWDGREPAYKDSVVPTKLIEKARALLARIDNPK